MINNQITHHRTTEVQPAMAGFFSWLKDAVKIAGEIAGSVLPFGGIIKDFTDGDGIFMGFKFGNIFGGLGGSFGTTYVIPDIPISRFEEIVLDEWLHDKFNVVLSQNLNRLKGLKTGFSQAKAVSAFNETQALIGFLKYFTNLQHKLPQDPNLTNNGILARDYFLKIQIGVLEYAIEDMIAATGFFANTKTVRLSFQAAKFRVLDLNAGASYSFNAVQVVNDVVITPTPTKPGSGQIVAQNPGGAHITITPGTPIKTEPTNPVTSPSTLPGTKEPKKWLMWGVVATGLYFIIKPKTKK